MIKKNKFGCFLKLLGLILICCVAFVVVIGGSAAIDKSVDKLCEYRDSVSSKIANKLGLQLAEKDTTIYIVKDSIPKKLPFNPEEKGVIKIKIETKDNMMYIKPKINGIEMRFLLDTWCHDIHLTPVEVLFLEHQGLLDSKNVAGTTKCIYADGKEHECVEYILQSVELAGIKIDSVKCTSDPEGGAAEDSPLFGQSMLRSFGDIMINYSDSTLIIKKKYGK
jgi:predicted aspartyl protease